jgi:RNA polymerase sigma-70 factor (ECF subfamily)
MTEERQLVDKAIAGDKEAFSSLVDLHKDKVINIAYKLLNNYEAAQDVAQESFIKAYMKLGSFKKQASFMTWLYRVTYNTACNYLRKNKVDSLFLNEELLEGQRETPEETELKDIVNEAVESLPIKLKTVIVLRDYEALSYKEIAEVIGKPIGTVESRLARAREKLKEMLEGYVLGE